MSISTRVTSTSRLVIPNDVPGVNARSLINSGLPVHSASLTSAGDPLSVLQSRQAPGASGDAATQNLTCVPAGRCYGLRAVPVCSYAVAKEDGALLPLMSGVEHHTTVRTDVTYARWG